jgi:hypothetical protein
MRASHHSISAVARIVISTPDLGAGAYHNETLVQAMFVPALMPVAH